ncbi:ATP-binding protein [Granulosicoccus antarcticus]|uniref:histidine kinase n=1 Tax=Granulosicoccus antarcticus IMCC3135 TaxID=1192854 RepID=A0A2Z2NRR8_9GAMM|nr:ATP-binding protein [Granulosicoccus antarcticus]ASJ74216.1 Autoinducer 2 sensor kinase/phosphatase LuxQ [Granulosicoccus antarcticus IMCC3135]
MAMTQYVNRRTLDTQYLSRVACRRDSDALQERIVNEHPADSEIQPTATTDMSAQRAPQKIFPIRRKYNSWVANESMEDYALRYTARSVRKFSIWRVGNTAFGAASFLALEAIGAAMVLNYGFMNTLWAIIAVAAITFMAGLPISYYAARYGVDMDLLTRGAGFGYLGSTISSLVYASFTIIFFAFETAILAVALQMWIPLPLWAWYVICSLLIVPLVARGITLISRIQLWSQIPWLALLIAPYIAIAWKNPQAYVTFSQFAGSVSGSADFDPILFASAATIAFALCVQIGEQVDFLRFLPERTPQNRFLWWSAVILAGPGWILTGAMKMLGGAFLAFLLLEAGNTASQAMEPTRMYLLGFEHVFDNPRLVLFATLVFVVISQVKINIVNAYAGSLAWSNFFARLTYSHPGRVVWLIFNCLIAILVITLGVFESLEHVLGLYSTVAVAWVGTLVADLVINKPLGLSPKGIEFKRAHLHDFNPVGLGSMALSAAIGMTAQLGVWGAITAAFAPFLALGCTFIFTPLLAILTRSRYYLARTPSIPGNNGKVLRCTVCENLFETDDMAQCPAYGAPICSLCCTLESRCHDLCKDPAPIMQHTHRVLSAILPNSAAHLVNRRVGSYLFVLLAQSIVLGSIIGLVYLQSLATMGTDSNREQLDSLFFEIAVILLILVTISSWWTVLGKEGRRMAQDELNRQNELLIQESEAHRLTDSALQKAKELAEQANQAKSSYVAGMSHELRSPLNGILGYSQILLHDESLSDKQRSAVQIIHRSGEHQLDLINELLDLARIEADRVRLEPAPLPLDEFFKEVLQMIRPLAEAKDLQLNHACQGIMPDFVHADAKRMRQILINLLSNAVRFTDAGRITLAVAFTDNELVISVQDTGIGISLHDKVRIFEPFERGSAGRQRGEPGAGLGLTITEKLVSLMKGRLTLHSEPNQGSTFKVFLPLIHAKPPSPNEAPEREVIGHSGSPRRLLVVDDQAVQRHMLIGMLTPLGFSVREAASGTECLEQLDTYRPDAILLDLSMAGLDGWQTARKIRARGIINLPIIIVSADVLGNHAQKMSASQCQAFVAKPVLESELRAALKTELDLAWIYKSRVVILNSQLETSRAPQLSFNNQDRDALLRLVRIGHANGLHELLDELLRRDESLTASCTTARDWLDRFELDHLEELLLEIDNAHL